MAKLFYETIVPAALSKEAWRKFCRELYATHNKIFEGFDADQFSKKMFPVEAMWTEIRVFKNSKKEIVGYYALHAYEKVIDSEKTIIFRAEAGILREYRKQGNISSFFVEVIKYKALHPFKKSYFFYTLIHPSSYHLLSKYFFRCYPNIRYATPPKVVNKMSLIADAFHEVRLPNAEPAIRDAGCITRQTESEQNELAKSKDPDTRFFLKKNPDYQKGYGLVTLVPLTAKNILLSSLIFLYSCAKNWICRRA
jgi:hypothetical protein